MTELNTQHRRKDDIKNKAVKQLLNSKKFLVANWAVFIAILIHKSGLNPEIQIMIISAFIALVGIQGTIDIKRSNKNDCE